MNFKLAVDAVDAEAASFSDQAALVATGERARMFKAMSPGMLPPLGIIFGLFVAFLAAQVCRDFDEAQAAVNREASALRAVVLLIGRFPEEPEDQMRALIRRQIEEAVTEEWPAMSRHAATLTMIPAPLAEALQLTLSLTPGNAGQVAAQQQIVSAPGGCARCAPAPHHRQRVDGQLGQMAQRASAGGLRAGCNRHGSL